MKEAHKKMNDAIREAVKQFEAETGLMVTDIKMNRAGSTSGYHIYGFYLPVVPFES